MAILQKFLFLFKSKYRRKRTRSVNGISVLCWLLFCNFLISQYQMVESGDCKQEDNPAVYTSPISPSICINGDCVNNSCVCRPGWRGQNCQFCTGKVKLQGIKGLISDGPGNYTTNMKCTWLIESDSIEKDVKVGNGSTLPSPIILRINEFATECGWDHLYIYDGDNVHAPLLGVFSGLLVQKNYKVLRFPEIVAKSGYALLHFYTDVAYNLTGFSIAYHTRSCPSDDSSADCSGNGVCVDGVCTCNAKYSGDACNIEKCPNNCSNQGTCNMELHRCQCKDGYKGHDCSQVEDQGYWEVIAPLSGNPKGSASHASIVHNNSLWVFGGNTLNMDTKEPILNHYSFVENKWNSVQHKGDITPPVLYGHSCVLVENKVYLYGGVHHEKFGNRYVSNNVWSFDLTTRSWAQVSVKPEQCKREMCGALHLAGHTALVININEKGNKSRHLKMVVIFGHSPRYGYVNVVQEFHFGSKSWNVMTTKGYPVGGIYGHSSSWDPYSQKIYVFGGYRIGQDTAFLSNSLYSYDPMTHTWQMMESGPGGRFLHAAVVNKGLLMVFGGNGHNDTSYSIGTKCFTSEVLVYDIECDTWSTLQPPSELPTDISRYGHTVEQYQESIYMYGGYNGIILNDLIRFTPAICEALYSDYQCINSRKLGVKCVWNDDKCENATNTHSKDKAKEGVIERRCLDQSFPNDAGRDFCDHFRSCAACVHAKRDCVWCGERCYANKCKDSRHKTMSNLEQCNSEDNVCGYFMHNCPLCHSETGCIWGKDDQCTKDPYHHNGTAIDRDPVVCEQGCADLTSCSNCTANNCMWCNDLNTCVEKNAYVISFPYGQCMSWAQSQNLCLSKDPHSSVTVSICGEVPSCDTCLSLPSCGWCDGGTGTGLGRCMDGSSRGPLIVNTTGVFLNKTLCKADRWHFTDCPACQCNGHSSCDEKNNCYECEQYTEGDHCQVCMPGFYGTAMNGGKCKPCECNSQADTCHPETGRCFCTTKGITGEDCARCDTQNSYSGDPTNGSCFYDLQIDYQFTFNLSKKEDRHYTKINFRNSPPKPDIDADFQIICSVLAKLNISVSKGGLPEKFLFTGWNCTSVKFRFSKTEYTFGNADNTTFYVYVYDFQPPLWIQIAFSQSPKLDLLHFFITFSTCFLLLLLVAAVLWKIKQKYDMYRRRQRLFVEMEQMASRPFSQVYVELGKTLIPARMSSLRKRRKEWPSPIALEPCQGNRAAVLSLLVTLPTGSQHFAPPGQSGLSVGSALVALGNPRKVSFEPISKTEGKNNKLRKSLPSHSLNTCI